MTEINTETRIMKLESVCENIRSEMYDVLLNSYRVACEAGNREIAAKTARKIRNYLLTESDKECTVDRVLPDSPTGDSFEDWLPWLKNLAASKNSPWSLYRKALRDLPTQEGFPFNVTFPEKP